MSPFKHNDDAPFHPNHAGQDYCVVCNRKVGADALLMEVYGGGAIPDRTVIAEPDLNDGGYMGCYPVGSECAKKFEKGVLRKTV